MMYFQREFLTGSQPWMASKPGQQPDPLFPFRWILSEKQASYHRHHKYAYLCDVIESIRSANRVEEWIQETEGSLKKQTLGID